MAGFIKLTNYYGDKTFWVNPDQIWIISKGVGDKATSVYHGSDSITVKESPEIVMELTEKQN